MKVLIVDDSIVFRTAIKSVLIESPKVDSIDVASNGKIALDKLKQNKYDAITLDLEMPVMDGTETIKEIRKFDSKIAIIIFSAQSINAANKTLKALELGADDFVQKIQDGNNVNENLQNIKNDLIPKFDALLERRYGQAHLKKSSNNETVEREKNPSKIFERINVNEYKPDLICIGSSTGGPDLLGKIFSKLNKLNVPVLIVQHMPPFFTTQLATNLNRLSGLEVREAKGGEILEPGVCYLAPGDFHMRLEKKDTKYVVNLDQKEKVCFVRPAVDCLFESVVDVFDGKVASFILTGMGSDGANGCLKMKKRNNAVIIQDEDSSVVWGMPGAVYETAAYDSIETPTKIINIINNMGTF